MRWSTFQRYLLPGFVFQSVVIAGGYGTGRELVELSLARRARGAPVSSWRALIPGWEVPFVASYRTTYQRGPSS